MGWTQRITGLLLAGAMTMSHAELWDRVEHGFAENDGVRIHYAAMGEGPLVVMIHGFPDFWYSWRHQMEALATHFRVVAIDQRGYNGSDQPAGEEPYGMRHLTADVAAVIREHGQESAIVAGHDWGGMVAWQFAFNYPQMVEQLIILNLPHPNGLGREMVINPEQRAGSEYAFRFQQGSPADPDIFFGAPMTPQTLSAWVTDPDARQRYIEAFERSDFDAMLAYYKRNYPSLPPAADTVDEPVTEVPALEMPVLLFHGLDDTALQSDGLNNTWDWIDADMTLVTVPGAGHFVQQDAAGLVSDTMKWWLLARQPD
ncbi:MAG: alpha/beta hydrolase [Pseudohongiellaceae bacterium]